ncbi:nucleotidyl transferase AbiEii/AbiGii toxin family protein [Capillimicrobium parvum]|uniref:nucleotidyl transferase AbiEii/AbiGii toxin family protein n=1 Tax=Capillimicrobium parvum TaxID=2884022 RepID=UPI00216B157E|nr:nucleotidyl transferase AbiEii/AbiGii toxin family protein [Capillimicrobium parvum]
MAERFSDGREKPRFRDLIDLQPLDTFNPDLSAVREACDRVFAARGQHAWPPALVVQPSWPAAYRVLADGLVFSVNDVVEAVRGVQDFVARIAAA